MPDQPRTAASSPDGALPVIRVHRVVKQFGGVTVLRGLCLSLAAGESLGLTGPNGCGKTTLINIISGFLRPERGQIWLEDREITGWPPHRVVRAGIARTFQLPRLSFRLSVEQNLRAATLHRHLRRWEAEETVSRILELVGLQDLRAREGRTLSQGQIRRVEVARALATGARLLLLDEPFASLSPGDAPEVLSALRRLRVQGISMIVVAHSHALFQTLCDRVAVIEGGRVVHVGGPAETRRA